MVQQFFSIQEEIYNLRQEDLSVAKYYNELVRLWVKEDALSTHDLCDLGAKCKSTRCMLQKKEQDRVMKFLIGLNEAHYQVRSQTLAMDPLPNVKEIYNIIPRCKEALTRNLQLYLQLQEIAVMSPSDFRKAPPTMEINIRADKEITGQMKPRTIYFVPTANSRATLKRYASS